MQNALTIDMEEFFQVHALSDAIHREDWIRYASSVEDNTARILDILASQGVQATFFCLGWIAAQHPHLIKRIHARGHEIACHGYWHQVIYNQNMQQFREDVSKAKDLLEDLAGEAVIGYRAPTYSITERTLWALDILEELGFRYDSSIFPIRHDNYGIPHAPRFPYKISGYDIVEFPISTVRVGRVNLPIAGGGYFRLLPYLATWLGLKSINSSGNPFIFYIHPWEFNPHTPKVPGLSPLSRFRTYVGLSRTASRFARLASDFPFTTCRHVLFEQDLLDKTWV